MLDRNNSYSVVANMVRESEKYRDTLAVDRKAALEYYDGVMNDTKPDADRSALVMRDVRSTVQKVLPAMTRVFLGNDNIVEYMPVAQGDEDGADQASDYINSVVFQDAGGPRAVTDYIHDALTVRNAILTWEYQEKTCIKVSSHSGLSEDAMTQLVADDSVTVIEQNTRKETVQIEGQDVPSTVYDLKIRRKNVDRKPLVWCLEPEKFLIHPHAIDEDTAPLIGRVERLSRSDLVAMGYDKDKVWSLPSDSDDSTDNVTESDTRRINADVTSIDLNEALKEIDYYELYVRIDMDGDGIAELRRMCFGGKITTETLLDDEEADDVPYAIGAAKTVPHQWEGVSIYDDIRDLQRARTVLLRQTLDNLYWQNNMQLAVQADQIENMEAVNNPKFGQSVHVKNGVNVNDVIKPLVVPFVAQESFGMLGYLDEEKKSRTGISDASGGLPPDALQNMTAKASAMIEQQGIGQTELMARTLAIGLKRMFRGLLRIIIKHQDKPRTVRLRDDWVEFDPRQWNSEMDCTINTGLGAGTRERDMVTVQAVLGLQREILANMGPQNPYVKPENLSNSLDKFIESAGLKSPRLYFSKPDEQEIAAMQEAQANAPNPEMIKLEASMKLEEMKVKSAIEKENAQSQADIQTRQAEANIDAELERFKATINAENKTQELVLKKYEIDKKAEIEILKLNQSKAMTESQMSREDARHYAPLGMDVDEGGKPFDKANARLEQMMGLLIESMNKPRRNVVRTPDGEVFEMESVN